MFYRKKDSYPKLFSTAHMSAAKLLFPDKINLKWCKTKWRDDEINLCKSYELKKFIDDPCLINYPL